MNKSEKIAVVLLILATLGPIVLIPIIEEYRRSKKYTLTLIAREPDKGNWYPKQIRVPYGKEVKILIRNIETVSHGFALPAFHVAVPEIKAGHVAVVEFTPDKRGTFPFMCTIWCSDRHLDMTGELIVE